MAIATGRGIFWVAGAAIVLTMLAIKFTQFFPGGLYFWFSEGYSAEAGAFLVPAPVVDASDLCPIEHETGYTFKSCPMATSDSATSVTETKQTDFVKKFFAAEPAILKSASLGLRAPVDVLEDQEEPTDLLRRSRDIDEALDQLTNSYAGTLTSTITDQISSAIPITDEADEGDDGQISQPEMPEIADDDTVLKRFAAGAEIARSRLAAGVPVVLKSLTLSEIQPAMDAADSVDELPRDLADLYDPQVRNTVRGVLVESLAKAGLDLDALKRARDATVLRAAGASYFAAVAIRLSIPLLVGLVLGLLAKAATRSGVAFGTGAAAFLLVWPVVVLWDTVVSSGYADQRALFLIFYVVYVLSFASMGWLGTTLGQRLAARLWRRWQSKDLVSPTFIRDLTLQLGVAAITNGLTIALSIFVFGSKMSWNFA